MITPYRYRYTLGSEAERTKDGKYKVCHNGNPMEIESKEVEFNGFVDEEGIPKKLTVEEFSKITEGTVGIVDIFGEFKDQEITAENLKKLGFEYDYKTDSLSGYSYYEYTLKLINVAYTIVESAGQHNIYTIYVGSIIDYVRNLTKGSLIFSGKVKTMDEMKVLLKQLGING
jgi:hypothetical protein